MKKYIIYFYFLLSIVLLSSCVNSKKWQPNQYLLVKQEVKGNKHISYDYIYPFFRQKTNRKILFFYPYVWAYNFGKSYYKPEKAKRKREKTEEKLKIEEERYASNKKKLAGKRKRANKHIDKLKLREKEGNWMMRAVGEAPVFYDSILIEDTRKSIGRFLQTKGYFQATVNVTTEKKEKSKRLRLSYNITENLPTEITQIDYLSTDTALVRYVKENLRKTTLKVGDRYDQDKMSAEQYRIEQLLKNNGYFDFTRQYIVFSVDTNMVDSARTDRKIASIKVIINTPKGHSEHKVYTLDNIYFHTAGTQGSKYLKPDTLKADVPNSPKGVKYIYQGKQILYSPRILNTRLGMEPGDRYKLNKVIGSQRGLVGLDMFKFVNISFDTTSNQFTANIFTSPIEKFQISAESGLNVGQGLPGPFVNFNFKNRNPFRGCELFENNFQFLIDGQTAFSNTSQFYSSQEISFNTSITFPRILFPTKLRYAFNYMNPKTKIVAGFNIVNRPEYTRFNLRSSLNYVVSRNSSTYNFTFSELNIVQSTITSQAFQDQLNELFAQGNSLLLSFNSGIVNSSYFTYTFNNAGKEGVKNPKYLRLLAEAGGGFLGILDKNFLGNTDKLFGLQYFQFWKLSATYHYQLTLRSKQALAFRVHAGIAAPYGNSVALPYEKYFFSGGTNSLRAWRPRRLGPGSFALIDSTTNEIDYRFERPGNITFEANIEYRFPIIGFISGALFVDAGNVWFRDPVADLPGADFQWNRFYKEIAVGTGFGLRFDFSFLIVRFDAGIKVYDPARIETERFVLPKYDIKRIFNSDQTLLNIGIGYPF